MTEPVTIKAIADGDVWALDVLGCPYYGPNRGRDESGEYFSPATNFYPDHFPLPPLVYYHGWDEHGRPASAPQFMGKAISREVRADGVWYRVVLDKASAFAARIWEAAKRGAARASSGTAPHLMRKSPDGHITHWPVVELSLMDTDGNNRRPCNSYAVAVPALKAIYEQAGIDVPAAIDEELSDMTATPASSNGAATAALSAEDVARIAAEAATSAVKAALKSQQDEEAAAKTAADVEQAKIDAAVKAAREEWAADFARTNRLPDGASAPVIARYAAIKKYDNLDAGDMAVLIEVLDGAKKDPGENALKALAIKLGEDETRIGDEGRLALKAMGLSTKANEVMQQSLVGSGRDWVGQAFSQTIWERVRLAAVVAGRLPSVELPQGVESITLPLEGADPVFYRVGEASSTDATGLPAATVKSSKAGTDSRTLNTQLVGARVLWSGSMEEDSLIPFVPQLRGQLATAGMEQIDHLLIDGDTATAAATNINHAGAGGTPAADDLYTSFDGIRKLALVTNPANSRAGAALTLNDFFNTVKLMGVGGINGLDRSKVMFLVDPLTFYTTMQLIQAQERSVLIAPQVENGQLVGISGYALRPSGQIAMKGGGLTNATGRVDQTNAANNTKGQILAVRPDQWLLGYKRRMTTEVTRIARADTTEIVCLMRVGLKNRDLEGAAITYNLTV